MTSPLTDAQARVIRHLQGRGWTYGGEMNPMLQCLWRLKKRGLVDHKYSILGREYYRNNDAGRDALAAYEKENKR